MSIKKTSVDFDITNVLNKIYGNSYYKPPIKHTASNYKTSNQYYRPSPSNSNIPVKVQLKRFNNISNSSTSTVISEKQIKNQPTPIKNRTPSISVNTTPNVYINTKVSSSSQKTNEPETHIKKVYHRKSSSQSVINVSTSLPNAPINRSMLSASNSTKNYYYTKKTHGGYSTNTSYSAYTVDSNNYYDNIVHISDLILLEERLNDIIRGIMSSENDTAICHACFEWWIFYFASSLSEKYKNFFLENSSKLVIHSANNLELFVIMLTYDIANNPMYVKAFRVVLKTVFTSLKNNYLLIVRKILSSLSEGKANDICARKLNEVLIQNKIDNYTERDIVMIIKENCSSIVDYMKLILMQYQLSKSPIAQGVTDIFNTISKISNANLYTFFFEHILVSINKNRSIINSSLIHNKKNFKTIDAPYITKPLYKKYTLVLDLDETLICFKFKSQNDNSGTLYLRPGLFSFLREMKKDYELISFTAATKEYAEPILNSIESKEKYFDYRFYREHAVVDGKDFVKDISRIGRELKKIVIVDNMGMNFRLNSENGILIYPYYYQDKKDTALMELKTILIKIANEGYNDIRDGLFKYRNEITMKVSSNNNSLI